MAHQAALAVSPDQPQPEIPLTPLQERLFAHPYMQRAVDTAVSAAVRPGGPQFVAVYGPPGSGKSRTCQIVANALAHHWRDDLTRDPTLVPVVRVEAPAAAGEFGWRNLFLEILGELHDPAVDRLIGADNLDGGPPATGIRPGRLSGNELQRIAERRFLARGVRVLLIDEAQHMTSAADAGQLARNLDLLKSFANKTGCRIVLVGTYALLEFHRASAQLARRMLDVHLPRYHWEVEHERRAFENVAQTMLTSISGLEPEQVEASLQDCYERSLGCVGFLRDWLVQAEFEFHSSGRSWRACLADTAASVGKVSLMLEETSTAEHRTRASAAARRQLRAALGLDTPAGARSSPPQRTGRRVGRRNPSRDPVGPTDG